MIITIIIFILRMGSISACCEHANDMHVPANHRDSFDNIDFEATDTSPKITNELISERLKELSSSRFKFNSRSTTIRCGEASKS
jgi:hypothetical protein